MNKIFKKAFAGLCASFLLLSSTACASYNGNTAENQNTESEKLQVYTSFYGMYDFTTKIAGDAADVYNLIPPGTEPHDWEPSTGDMVKLEKADLLVYNGAGFEGWVDSVKNSLSYSNLTFLEASEGVPLLTSSAHDHDHDGEEEVEADHEILESSGSTVTKNTDPHVWLDPENVKIEMTNIANALKQLDPENSETYDMNLAQQLSQLDDLLASMEEAASTFQKHDIIVAHEAYGYLCYRLDLTQYGIEGLSADSDPTPTRMAELAKVAKEKEVRYIFFETLVSSKTAETLAKEVGIESRQLDPFEGPGSKEAAADYDYYSVMNKNMEVLKEALS